MMEANSPSPDITPIRLAGQVAVPAQQPPAAFHRLIEMEILEAVQRIVMHKRPHRPVLGDNLA